MKTIEVYSFDELDEQAQQAAIEKYRYDVADIECDSVNSDFEGTVIAIEKQLDLKSGRKYTDLSLKYPSEYYNIYCVDYDEDADIEVDKEDCYESVVDWLISKKNNFKYNDTWYFTGCYSDDAACRYIDDVLSGKERPNDIKDFVNDLGSVIERNWEDECDNCSSDEVVSNFLSGNDWEFTADGKRV